MFSNVQKLPPDSIFGTVQKFQSDANPKKINLSVGVYTDEEGNPFVFESVKEAATRVQTKNFNYLPIQGDQKFLENTKSLFLPAHTNEEFFLAMQQTCGGTHACSLFSQLVKTLNKKTEILIGVPTWDNYFQIFADHDIVTFPHLTAENEVNVDAYMNACSEAKEGSVLILQGGATHNPTGLNLSLSNLEQLFPLIHEKKIFVLVDFAYLGFGQGFAEDRKFLDFVFDNVADAGCTISYSKNASLYKHRAGALFIKAENQQKEEALESQLQYLVRQTVSNMPAFGSDIINELFANNFDQWSQEVDNARLSIDERRQLLVSNLLPAFSHLKNCRGMFGLSGLTKSQVEQLQDEASIYMLDNGRINFAGIKLSDIENIASAITKVIS